MANVGYPVSLILLYHVGADSIQSIRTKNRIHRGHHVISNHKA
jgi:hypothetical protein